MKSVAAALAEHGEMIDQVLRVAEDGGAQVVEDLCDDVGPRLGSRIAAALENIEALWPSIKQPPRSDKTRTIEPATLL